jgi:hypothetical protein
MPAPPTPNKIPEGMLIADSISLEEAKGPPSTDPASSLESGTVPDIVTPELSLDIEAKEMTLIRIFVDDQKTRE